MKKSFFCVMLSVFALVLLMTACGEKEVVVLPTEEPTEAPTEPVKTQEELEIEEFFAKYINTDERPIAVMVDNDDKNARPHAGLDEAYLVYEMMVEGGATRFMGVFKGVDTEKIGPVRSSRHYFLDYVLENDAIYTHYGWSPLAIQQISQYNINKINGVLGTDGGIFWREEKYKGDWHSAYTSIKNIKEMADKKGYRSTPERTNGLLYAEEYFMLSSEISANTVTLPYSGFYKTGYTYNAESGLYEKTINGAPHVMQNGNVLQVKNIIVELAQDFLLGDGTDRKDIKTTGSGKGYYITGGKAVSITWEKASKVADTVYKTEDGNVLKLNPGKTIINLINPSIGVTFE